MVEVQLPLVEEETQVRAGLGFPRATLPGEKAALLATGEAFPLAIRQGFETLPTELE
jgi:hypothetical protein